jgi:DNA primase
MDEGMIRSEALIYARKNKSNVYISQNMPVEKEELDLNPLKKST